MKIRNGFVSNSSSSSFIVAIPKSVDVSDPEQVREVLFGDDKTLTAYDDSYPTKMIAATVSSDFSEQDGVLPTTVDSDEEDDWYGHDHNDEIRHLKQRLGDKVSGYNLFEVSYADDDGPYFSTLEHGDIFHEVPHIRISHH